MSNEHSIKDGETLRKRIEAMPEDSVLFRSDFPEYHSEFVGETLAELTKEGVLVKLAQGIYAKPRMSRFGAVLPSVEKIVQAIAVRDNAKVLPSGMTALNALGLSTQVPMNYTYLTTGSERTVKLTNRQVVLKRGVPKNFWYETRLIALLVQALKTLKQENVGQEELQIIRSLIEKEPDKETQISDRYIVSVDVGGRNPTSDWSVIRVFDRFAMIMGGRPELVAQMRYHTDYDLLAYDSMRVAHWYNDALLVIESNTMETRDKDRDIEDMSEYILDIIAGLYDNLYARAGNPESVKQGKPRRWGFQTNSSTKPAIIGHLIECVREHLWIERDAYCVEELALYEKNDKGQFSAPPGRGNHDDVVMATAIALWISNREMDTPQFVVPLGNDLLRHADPNNNAAI